MKPPFGGSNEKTRLSAGFIFAGPGNQFQAAVARALTLADRRLLWRAALFLWKRPLSATESITLCVALKISVAFALSPAATAFWTFLMTVRNFERSAVLAAFSL